MYATFAVAKRKPEKIQACTSPKLASVCYPDFSDFMRY